MLGGYYEVILKAVFYCGEASEASPIFCNSPVRTHIFMPDQCRISLPVGLSHRPGFVKLVITVALALILSSAVTRVEKWLLPWRHDLR